MIREDIHQTLKSSLNIILGGEGLPINMKSQFYHDYIYSYYSLLLYILFNLDTIDSSQKERFLDLYQQLFQLCDYYKGYKTYLYTYYHQYKGIHDQYLIDHNISSFLDQYQSLNDHLYSILYDHHRHYLPLYSLQQKIVMYSLSTSLEMT